MEKTTSIKPTLKDAKRALKEQIVYEKWSLKQFKEIPTSLPKNHTLEDQKALINGMRYALQIISDPFNYSSN